MGLPAPYLATQAPPPGGLNLLIAAAEDGRDQAMFLREALLRACPKRLAVSDTLEEGPPEALAAPGGREEPAPAWAVERAAAALAARCHAAAVLLNGSCWDDRWVVEVVRAFLRADKPVALIHDYDYRHGGCVNFGDIIQATPQELKGGAWGGRQLNLFRHAVAMTFDRLGTKRAILVDSLLRKYCLCVCPFADIYCSDGETQLRSLGP